MFDDDPDEKREGIKVYQEGDVEDSFTLGVTNIGAFNSQHKALHDSLAQ